MKEQDDDHEQSRPEPGEEQAPEPNEKMRSIVEKMRTLEKELIHELQKKEKEFGYEVNEAKVRFTAEAKARHKTLVKRLYRYVTDSKWLTILSMPFVWACLLPLVALDLVTSLFQRVCFPIYGIPKVVRGDYIVIDRHHLSYLNGVEKMNCAYCGYANGLLAYVGEMAGRAEQYWCPIKHALRLRRMHSRYDQFMDYGDADRYRDKIEDVRRDFEDLG